MPFQLFQYVQTILKVFLLFKWSSWMLCLLVNYNVPSALSSFSINGVVTYFKNFWLVAAWREPFLTMAVKSIRAPGITNNKSQNIETKRQKKTWIGYRNTINCVQWQLVTDNNDNYIAKDKMILRFWLAQIPPLIFHDQLALSKLGLCAICDIRWNYVKG